MFTHIYFLPALLLTMDKCSSWRLGRVVPMILLAVRTTRHSLLRSDLVADSHWSTEDGFNDGRVELFQQLLWQVELPQLAKEIQHLLCLFHNGLNVIVPLQVQRNCDAQESEWLHCSHSAAYDGEWGESRGVSPEVHDYLHSFERVKLQDAKNAPDSQLFNLLSVSRLVTYRLVFRVLGVQGEEKWGENTALRSSSGDSTGAGWEFSQPQ